MVCLAAPCARFCSVWSHAPQILCLSRPRHLLRPSDATRRRVGRRAEAAGLRRAPRPLLGIHVRRGDSCREVQEATKARRCSPFAEYWYHALAMRARGGVQAFISVARSSPQARYGIRSVFLATDDPSVVDEARIAATTAGLPLYAMLANPPASAGTAPPPLWDSARPRVRLSSHDPCRGRGDLCLLGARASRRRRVFRGSWRRRRPGAPRALRRVRRQVHLEPRPHRVFAPCGAVRVPETGRLPRFALVPRLVQSSRPVPFRVVCVLMRGLPGRRAVNFRCRGKVIETRLAFTG